MMIEDLNDLYLFSRVVEAGGFAAAERQTGIPKSRLSRRVAALERQLNVRLIQRSAQNFAVTEVGLAVYQHARRMAEEAEALAMTVGEALNEPRGLIRVSASVLAGESVLAGWLAEYQVQHPRVRIALSLSNRFVDLIAERFDLAIRYSSRPLESADIVARRLGASRMVLAASPRLIDKLGEPADVADLDRFPALAQGTFENARAWTFTAEDGSQIVYQPKPIFVTDNILALRAAAEAGAGVVQIPVEACRDALRAGTLREILAHRPSAMTPVYAMYPSRRGMTAALRSLLEVLEQRFRAFEEQQR